MFVCLYMFSWKEGSLACSLICLLPPFYLIKAEAFYTDKCRCLHEWKLCLEEAVPCVEEARDLPMLGARDGYCITAPGSTLSSALTLTDSAPSHPAPTVFSFSCSSSQGLRVLENSTRLC